MVKLDNEEWRPVVGWEEAYEVSSLGRVRSLDREINHGRGLTRIHKGRVRAEVITSHGYPSVGLSMGERRETKLIHRMLAEAFIENPDDLPYVRHLNDVKTDYRLENLAWGTASDNSYDAVRNGVYKNQNMDKTHCKRGHLLAGENLLNLPGNRRGCKECAYYLQKKNRDIYQKKGIDPESELHGTTSGYSVYGCRCEPCKEAKRVSDRGSQRKRALMPIRADDPRHGTYSFYKTWSCRCSPCKEANRNYEQERRSRKNEQP